MALLILALTVLAAMAGGKPGPGVLNLDWKRYYNPGNGAESDKRYCLDVEGAREPTPGSPSKLIPYVAVAQLC